MNWFEALVLGLVQGLTEYLPVSSSGHLAIGAYLFGINGEDNLTFTIMVHVATVLSTLVILWKEIDWILKGLFKFQMNEETKYALNIVISMIPVGIVGVFFKDKVEEVFGSGLFIVGCMLLVTAVLLTFSYFAKPRQKENISPLHAFIIGLGQALAVLPGLSRSGTTILPFFTILIIHLQARQPDTNAATKPTIIGNASMPPRASSPFRPFKRSSNASPKIGGITMRNEN
jgi:undecaprenyl-diphosphatase